MEFPFGRQISKDSLLNKTGEAGRSLRSSITSGSSRLFDSVRSKKTGLFDGISSGISNTFDQVMTIGGGKEEEEMDGSTQTQQETVAASPTEVNTSTTATTTSPAPTPRQSEKPRPASRQQPAQPHQQQQQPAQQQPQQQAPPQQQSHAVPEPFKARERTPEPASQRVPVSKSVASRQPPARPTRPPVPSPRSKSNGSARGQSGKITRQQTAPADFDPSGDRSDFGMNMDETYHGRQYSLRSGSVDLDQDSGFQDTTSSVGGGSNTSPADVSSTYMPPVSTRISKNPFLNDPMPDPEFTTVFTRAEVHSDTPRDRPRPQQRGVSELDPVLRVQQLGSDLLPGIPRVPSNNTALLAPEQHAAGSHDLLAITPTSGEALPMPSLEPTRRSESEEIYDVSDGDSEATEGCDEEPDPEDYGGADYDYGEGAMLRSGSVGSEQSWNSSQSTGLLDCPVDEQGRACRDFMREFVTKIFSTADGVTQGEKATFGRFCQQAPGRLWFARYVNAQRASSKCTNEAVFYGLVQHFAVALFECNEADDFTPAKILMNMCFTFYLEVSQPNGAPVKHFLYSYLRDQPIWQSLRFWNAAFFDAVQHERARRPVPTRGTGHESQIDDRHYQENITFGQLGTFTCNMRAFGLSKQLCVEFIRKQATIANLSNDQILTLRDNIER